MLRWAVKLGSVGVPAARAVGDSTGLPLRHRMLHRATRGPVQRRAHGPVAHRESRQGAPVGRRARPRPKLVPPPKPAAESGEEAAPAELPDPPAAPPAEPRAEDQQSQHRGTDLPTLATGARPPADDGRSRLTIKTAAHPVRVADVRQTAYAEPVGGEQVAPPQRLAIPSVLPGADAPPLKVPRFDRDQPTEERLRQIESLFKPLPEIVAESVVPHDPAKPALALAELQQLAYDNSPKLRQAAADVETARGQAIQAGLYPNPVAGYEGDNMHQGNTAGLQGGFVSQEFVTAHKNKLARDVALHDMQAAEFALRRTRIELASLVRNGYFDVLVAQQRVKYTRALAEAAERVYRAQIELVAGGEAAAYEPLQLRVFALQARNAVRRAENAYLASWRQLAANLGLPDLAAAELAGSVDAPPPRVTYQAALNYLLAQHTDLAIAQTQIDKALVNLRLQRVTPIPNVNVLTVFQHDSTTLPNNAAFNLQVGVPLPVFNNNRGNIVAAEAQLVGAQQNWNDTRNTLTARLADIFQRYASNTTIAASYRTDILPDQVRTSRGVYEQFRQAGDAVDFAQVVVSWQALSQVIQDYLGALDDQWQAVVDLAQLLQVDDLFAMSAAVGGQPEPVPLGESAP